MLRHPGLRVQKVRVISLPAELPWRLKPSLSIRVIYDPEIEERLIRFFLKCISKGVFISLRRSSINLLENIRNKNSTRNSAVCLPQWIQWSNYQRVTNIWGPLPLWEYCWIGSAYNTMRLLLAKLLCLPQPPCTEILTELFYMCIWVTYHTDT